MGVFMRFKPSKHTTTVLNDQGELLLYNTITGYNSLCKTVKPEIVTPFLESGIEFSDGIVTEVATPLIQRGYLIEEWRDEKALFNTFHINAVSPRNLSLTIVPTNDCNFRCVYCWERFDGAWMSQETQDKIVQYVDKHMAQYTALHVSWFGGEPLLAIDILKDLSRRLMDVCKKHKKPYTASITTNGYLLSEDVFDCLRSINVLSYQVPIDGLRIFHDSRRVLANGEQTYDAILNNLSNISKKLKSRMYDFVVRVSVTKDMLGHINEIVDIFISKFGDSPQFRLLFTPLADLHSDKICELIDVIDEKFILGEVYERLLACESIPRLAGMIDSISISSGLCHAEKQNNYLFDPNGEVHLCLLTYENPSLKSKSCIGHVGESGNLIIDPYLQGLWLREGKSCTSCKSKEDCFFFPSCCGDVCSAQKVYHPQKYKGDVCISQNKQFLNDMLKIADKQKQIPCIDKVIN